MSSNSLWVAGAIAIAMGCGSERESPPIVPLPPGEMVEILSDGATYVSSVDVAFRDGGYVLAWTEWTEDEAIGKVARLAPGCVADGAVREIFRVPLQPADLAAADPVVIALDARGDRVSVLTAGNAPASQGDAVLWIVDEDIRSVSLGRLDTAALASTDRTVELAYQAPFTSDGPGPLVVASIDWTTLAVTTQPFEGEAFFIEPGFGTTPGKVALGIDGVFGVVGGAIATSPLRFDWGGRSIFANAFGSAEENLGVISHGPPGQVDLLEIDRAGSFVRRRVFPSELVTGTIVDANGIAALWTYDEVGSDPSIRRHVLYTPPGSFEARIVAELGDEASSLERYGYRPTLAGASGEGEVIAAFTRGLGDWWAETGERRESELRVRCFDASGTDLELSTHVLAEGEPPAPPIRDPSSCGADGYDLSSSAYARDDGSYSLTVSPEAFVTHTCTPYGGRDAIVRFTAGRAGAYTFVARGRQLWALQARSTCEDPASELACDELLDFHGPDPFGSPRDVRAPLEAGQTIWLVLDGCQGDPCSWELTALPPLAIGAACDGPAACGEGAACIGGFCTTPTPPSLASANVYHHARSWPDGTVEQRLMVVARGSDLTADVQRVLVWPVPDEEPIVFWGSSEDTAFTVRASRSEPTPTARTVRVAVEDATGLRSEVIEAALQPAPIRHLDELCDREEIEDVCAAGLACTEVSPGTTLCR